MKQYDLVNQLSDHRQEFVRKGEVHPDEPFQFRQIELSCKDCDVLSQSIDLLLRILRNLEQSQLT